MIGPLLPPLHGRVHLPIDDAPELAAALGRFMAHWGHLESLLITLLQLLLKIDNMKANFIYKEFVSTNAKINLLRRINHFYTVDQSTNTAINQLLHKADRLNTTRNSFMHAMWVGDIPEHIMRLETSLPRNYKQYKKPMKKLTPKNVQEQVEEIAQLSQSFQYWIARLLLFHPEPDEV